jgi:protein TonB
MKTPQKNSRYFSFFNRFLAGLVIALFFTLCAFEWTSEQNTYIIDYTFPETGEIAEILPPVTYRTQHVKKPELPSKTDQFKVVEQLFEQTKPEEKKEEFPSESAHEDLTHLTEVNLNEFGMGEEDLPYEEPTPYVSIQQYAHYSNCEGLTGEASRVCSEEGIIKKVYDNFSVSPILREMGRKQGSLVSFTIDEKGFVKDIEILQSTSEAMSKQVIKAIKGLPQMIPAQQQGHAVAIQMQLPIILHLK